MESHYIYGKIDDIAKSYDRDRLSKNVELFRVGVMSEDEFINRFMLLFACDNHAKIDDFLSVLSRDEMKSIGINLVSNMLNYIEGFFCGWFGDIIKEEDKEVYRSRISKAIDYYSDRVEQLLSSDSAERAAEQSH